MPQLNPEFFVSQLFWLVVTFSFLLVFLWRISLPRIGNVLEKRERKINEDLTAAKELQIEAEKILDLEKTNLWANKFLLLLAEEVEDWDYAEKKARDLKKIKGFDDDVGLSKYTLQKGIILLENNNFSESEKLFRKAR